MNLKKTFAVAKWEFLEKVKTKTFLISIFLTPAIIIGLSLAPTYFSGNLEKTTQPIAMVDTSGVYFKILRQNVESYKLKDGQPRFILINLTRKKLGINQLINFADSTVSASNIGGYLLIKNGGTDSVKAEFRSAAETNDKDNAIIQSAFNKTKTEIGLFKAGVNPSVIQSVSENIPVKVIKIENNRESSDSDFLELFFTGFIFIILLMFVILSSGGMLVRSLVEEKSNRLIEILISSCTPDELLTGKIYGLSALGFSQIIIWSVIGISLVGSQVIPAQVFYNFLPMLIYFVLGFIFYTSIFVGVGAIVTSEQEAQQITSYLSIILIIPIALSVPAIESPNSMFVHILSYIPFTLPSIMLLRLSVISIPFQEIIITIAIMLISIYLTITFAAKIFKIGILSYGKRPSLKDLIEWIRE